MKKLRTILIKAATVAAIAAAAVTLSAQGGPVRYDAASQPQGLPACGLCW